VAASGSSYGAKQHAAQDLKHGSALWSGAAPYWILTNRPSGFAYTRVGDDVVISHRGRHATTLRGARTDRFMEDVEDGDAQELMARLTGNYKRGNERTAKNHPRNQSRSISAAFAVTGCGSRTGHAPRDHPVAVITSGW